MSPAAPALATSSPSPFWGGSEWGPLKGWLFYPTPTLTHPTRGRGLFRRLPVTAVFLTTLLVANSCAATTWTVVPADSKIAFSGQHAGNTFKGVFEKWAATISFDPADLPSSKATVTVALASAKTGDQTYDKTLPTADWFDAARSPSAVFETSTFRGLGGDKFEADGTVSIRGMKAPVTLVFTFTAVGDTAKLTGATKLKRLDYGIGKGSDGDGSWVGLDIPVEVNVSLKK